MSSLSSRVRRLSTSTRPFTDLLPLLLSSFSKVRGLSSPPPHARNGSGGSGVDRDRFPSFEHRRSQVSLSSPESNLDVASRLSRLFLLSPLSTLTLSLSYFFSRVMCRLAILRVGERIPLGCSMAARVDDMLARVLSPSTTTGETC